MDLWEFSDDDEEIIEFIARPITARQLFPRSDLFNTLSDEKFVRRFRLTKATTIILLERIEQSLKYRIDRATAVTPMNQLLCALRFYATGSQLIICGDMIGVHESTACRIVHRVTHAIASLRHMYITYPTSEDELNALAIGFYKIAKFPRVIGAIDCTHVRIISPGDIVARWHGSAHDSNIWDNCALKRSFLQGKFKNKVLLGDSGYAQTSYMMTPLADGSAVSRAERLYQESQIKTRNVVERAFGLWKRRFPILSRGINIHLHKVPGIIIATAVLHNIAITQNDQVPPEDPDYPVMEELSVGNTVGTGQLRGSRNLERRVLIEQYFASL
ncbi:unnamed protein product [Colias eurytheme]|nr:unnamed protein product [Colias eurytheme]